MLPPRDPTFFYQVLFRHRIGVWILSGLLIVFCLWSATGLEWHENILDLLPDGDEEVRSYREWMSRFRPMDRAIFLAGPNEESQTVPFEDLAAVANALGAELSDDPENLLQQVTFRVETSEALEAFEVLRRRRAAFFTEKSREALEAKLSPEAIRRELENWKRVLTSSPAPFLAREFRADPLGLDENLRDKLAVFQSLGGPFRVHEGWLCTQDLKQIVVLAQPRHPSADSAHAAEVVRFLEQAVARAQEKAPSSAVRVAWLAGHRFAFENAQRIKADLKRTVAFSLFGIALLTFVAFSRPIFAALALLPALFGGIVATGLIRWLEPGISAIAIGCGSMLIGIAVDYGIHILYHHDSKPVTGDGDEGAPAVVPHILARLQRPLLLSAATTIAAFLVLLLSVMPGYRHLGLFAALGIGAAAGFAILVMPLLIPLLGIGKKRAPLLNLAGWSPRFAEWANRHRGILLLALTAASIGALAGLPRLGFEGDYEKLNAATTQTQEDRNRIRDAFEESFRLAGVTVRERTLDAALEKADELSRFLETLKNEGLLAGFSTVAPLFPSRAIQEENRRRWLDFWTPERVAALRRDLEAAAENLRLNPDAFSSFLEKLPGETPLFDPSDSGNPWIENLFSSYVSIGPDDVLVRTDVRPAREGDLAALRERLSERFPGVRIAEGRAFMEHTVGLIHRELKRMGLIALLAVLALLAIVLRDARRVLVLLLPLLVSVLWTFGLLGWLGIRINLMNSVITIFIFGLVIDYSIFLFFAWSGKARDPHFARSVAAVTISALTTLMGLGSLALARHPALHSIGLTALLAIGSGWAAVLLSVPLLRGGKRP